MPQDNSELGISPDLLELLRIALSTLPIDDVSTFVALMEAAGSVPSPARLLFVRRRVMAIRQRPRRQGWQPRKSLRRLAEDGRALEIQPRPAKSARFGDIRIPKLPPLST